jgi:PAS domain S-box-containing protein
MTAQLFRLPRFAFFWIAVVPVALTIIGLWVGWQFEDEISWISHTYAVRTAIRDTVLLAWNAERDLRNYVLSGQDFYLRNMEADMNQEPRHLEELRRLTADNPIQQRNVARFKPLLDTKIAELRRIVNLRNAGGVSAALSPAEVDRSQRLVEEIRGVARDMMEEEERLLLGRTRLESRLGWRAATIFASAIFVTLLLLFWAGRLVKRYAGQRDLAELALQQKVAEIETLNRQLELSVAERTAELKESNQKLAGAYVASRLLACIVESSDDAIIGSSLDGVIHTWNSGAERLYGYKPEEILGHNVSELALPDRLREESDILERLSSGERLESFDTVRLRKGGQPVEVSLTISPIHNEVGQITGASHVARDTTEQKRQADMMRQTQKLESLGILAGGIAHDFNNLLVGILGNASLAREQIPMDSPARMSINEILAASDRAAALTRQMLAYSGRGHFILERIDLSTYVQETIALIKAAIPRTVELRLDLDEDIPAIEADAAQVQQLVMNLVINGAEAIPDGEPGTVTIATRRQTIDVCHVGAQVGAAAGAGQLKPGLHALLEVSDTGSGMDESTRTRIFDPFFTTKFTGRGLGLAAVLGIVRGHSGSIQVSSSSGHGSVFRVLFPAKEGAFAGPLRKQQVTRDLTGRGTILVIDDEEIVCRMAKHALEHYGYSVVLAEDGERGLEVFRQTSDRIQCVVLDLTMPIMSGEQTLPRLKSVRADIPVILSSGFSEAEAVQRFQGRGLEGFIQKPYKAATLAEKVKDVIARL